MAYEILPVCTRLQKPGFLVDPAVLQYPTVSVPAQLAQAEAAVDATQDDSEECVRQD
ncbi:MAG: hypothetical protein WBX11_17145 [Thiobacillaceae bacterium]